ncbi:S41 family peptidase [Ichthyobacterium seriolicida]|uniref:Peptidase S41 n=1 Tax=Ichthyobacterium seriolicida TaxID=242600 RepID=A0A1J1E2Z9_9FLAO|nr:S41 family peptidase [Ichthyobacterium seriolicida]BAV94404.1 peptidase S41 [Ichthyobacterium seriolicida]
MKITNISFISLIITHLLFGCEKISIDKVESSPKDNFNVFCSVIKNKYSFLKDKNINWDSIVSVYKPNIHDGIDKVDEFNIYKEMLECLKDGHVNLTSKFDTYSYRTYFDNPTNFDIDIILRGYLKRDFKRLGGFSYNVIDGNYGYIYYSSFISSVSGIDYILNYMESKKVKGIILDVRNNGGGYLSNVFTLLSRFADKKRMVWKEYFKNGPRPDDFSDPVYSYVNPHSNTYKKKVVVLTNISCYSSTSYFATGMKQLPNVRLIGDITGGGSGSPVGYILPNGWRLRFSVTKSLDAYDYSFELGVVPHERLNMKTDNKNLYSDSIIERAKVLIDNNFDI